MKTKELLLALCLICASTAFSQKMYLTRAYSPFTEVKYTYGSHDKVIETDDQSSYHLKCKYTYNDLNQCIREDDYQWMDDDQEWLYAAYILYTHDEKGNLATRINYNLDPSTREFVKSGLMTYEYDVNNHLVTENTGIFFGEDKESATPYMRRTFTYDENGNMRTVLYEDNENMFGGDTEWIESIKGVYQYDDLGKLVADSSFTVSYETNDWVFNEKNLYVYDKNGNVTLHEYYHGVDNGTRWSISSFEEYEYDPSKLAAEYIYPVSYESGWPKFDNIVNERIKEISHQKDDNGIMQLYDTYAYEYSSTGTSSIETPQISDSGKLLIYPNPVKESFTLNLEDKYMPVYVYDTEGHLKVMFSNAEGTLDVSGLPTGIYFVKCGKHTAKLVKE